jgi:hypothetical protein
MAGSVRRISQVRFFVLFFPSKKLFFSSKTLSLSISLFPSRLSFVYVAVLGSILMYALSARAYIRILPRTATLELSV